MIHTTKESHPLFPTSEEVLDNQSLSIYKRVERFGKAKKNNLEMVEYLEELMLIDEVTFGSANPLVEKIYTRMDTCASWLTFRHYIDHGENRLTSANFCGKHLLCQACAIRRGAQKLKFYSQRIEHVLKQNKKLKPYLVTFTVKNGADLKERFEHLQSSFKHLHHRRKRGQDTEFLKINGAVFSFETPKAKDGINWHPHIHMLALCEEPPQMGWVNPETGEGSGLRKEWFDVTGDSYQVDVRADHTQPVIEMCMEVMKYAVKFSSQEPNDTWKCFQVLNRRRLFGSMGSLWGVKVPKSLLDEKLDGPYIEYMFRYFGGGHYMPVSKVDMSEHYEEASSLVYEHQEGLASSEQGGPHWGEGVATQRNPIKHTC